MIPQETIEQVRQATDIVQLIGEYIKLKKRGRRHLALCPFHTEKTPSFSVSEEKQLYYCFGCSKGGTVYNFLMEHEAMSFTEAVKFLARRANIQIVEDRQSDAQRERNEKIAYANQVALDYFQQTLQGKRYADILNKYLLDTRGLTNQTIKEFSLGLAGEEWDGLLRYAYGKSLSPQDLETAGLAIYSDKNKKHFDRFRQRLMIPIFNLSGKPIAFGGRTLKKGESAKYINSPETALYIKGNQLYGLYTSRNAIREANAVIVVEGYFDVMSLYQVGITNVVASSGTAFSEQQARLLARFAEEVYLFFDADSAGRKAAMRSVDLLFDAGMEVKVISAPPGEDPDSVARKLGRDGIDELVDDAKDYISFRVQDINLKEAGIIAREKLTKELATLGNKIGDNTRRELFLNEVAKLLRIDRTVLDGSISRERTEQKPTEDIKPRHDPIERSLLSILFHNPGAIDMILEKVTPDDFDSRELARLYAAIAQQYRDIGEVHIQALVDNARDNEFITLISGITATEHEAEDIDQNATLLLNEFTQRRKRRIRHKLKEQLAEAETKGDRDEADKILLELKGLGL